jgi:hypothetical protein
MEKEEFLTDDLLKDLFRNEAWETPGDDFTKNVMDKILMAEVAPVKKPFYSIVRSYWPFLLIFLVTVLVIMTSDLPFTDYIPGKEYFVKTLLPGFRVLFSGIKPFVTNAKAFSIPLMVILAGSLLVGCDHFLFRKHSIRHQTTN